MKNIIKQLIAITTLMFAALTGASPVNEKIVNAIEMSFFEELRCYSKVKNMDGAKRTFLNFYQSGEWEKEPWDFYTAIFAHGTEDFLTFALEKGVDPLYTAENGYTALHEAVYRENMPAVRMLVERGADVNATTSRGDSIFSYTSGTTLEIYHYLIKAGMKPDPKDKFNMLQESILEHNTEMTMYFKDNGYEFPKDVLENDELLLDLIRYQKTEIYKLLIENGLDLEHTISVYGDQVTLLHAAVIAKAKKVIPVLLEGGANPNAINSSEKPIFIDAIKSENMEVIRALYENGADPNFTVGESIHKKEALSEAFDTGNVEIIKYLVSKGANVSSVDREGYTPLHYAARLGDVDLIKMFIEKGGDVHALARDRKAPYDLAKRHGHMEAAEFLLDMEKSTPNKRSRK